MMCGLWSLTVFGTKFGAGRRVCLGKHLGIFEVKKLIPYLITTYDVSRAWCFVPIGCEY